MVVRIRRDHAREVRRRVILRRSATVVCGIVLIPAAFALWVFVTWTLGCGRPTIGGGAGRENDTCRDIALWHFGVAAVLACGVWATPVVLLRRWADRARED